MARDYRVALLQKMGFPVTKANLRFLSTWQAQEGGHTHNDARFNWWNTTKGSQFPAINSVGVRSFPDFKTGVDYTAATLNNGRYPDIMAGLKAGNPYRAPIADDLSVWVSGSPTKGLRYAQKVLGGKGKSNPARALASSVTQGKVTQAPRTGNLVDARQALMSYFIDSNNALMQGQTPPDFAPYGQMYRALRSEVTPQKTPQKRTERALSATKASGGFLQAPEEWKPTAHAGNQTDGLGWGPTGPADIMARAGTAVGAPEDGTILRHGSAQGGESLWFRSDDGETYWLGHVESDIPNNTRVKRGQKIAVISARHPNPHLHIDKR